MATMIRRQNDGKPFFQTPKIRRKPGLRTASPERAGELRRYAVRRLFVLSDRVWRQFKGCKEVCFDIHHKAGRSGEKLLDETNWLAICRKHHKWIHDFPNAARELGYLK